MEPERRRLVLAACLAALLVLAGCSGSGGDGQATVAGQGGNDLAYDQSPAAAEETAESSGGGDSPAAAARQAGAVQERHRIRTGETVVRVADFDRSVANLSAATGDLGGFVADTERSRHRSDNETWLTGRLVLRVPAGNFSTLRERVASEGTVLHAESSVDDVTGEVVDLQARLANLRAERDRLRGLYERANETEDVLAVGERLSDTQAEIEQLEGQLASLQSRVAYSTLTVRLREPEPDAEAATTDRPDWAETGVVAAFLDSVAGVGTTLRMLVVALAYLLPYAAVFGTPVVAVVVWRRRRQRGGADAVEDPGDGSEEQDGTE